MVSKSLSQNIFTVTKHGLSKHEIKAIIRKIVFAYFLVLTISVLPWTAVFSTVGSMVDQYFRNTVNTWMKESDLFDSISITPKEYASLPDYWRQTLAEISSRPTESAAGVKRLLSDLTLKDIKLIDLIAPYWTTNGLVRDTSNSSTGHPMSELSSENFVHLETLGILQEVATGVKVPTTGERINFTGESVVLVAARNTSSESSGITVTPFTRDGKQIMEALRVPSSVPYFEWIAKKIERNGARVELYTVSRENNNNWGLLQVQGQILRSSISSWPSKR